MILVLAQKLLAGVATEFLGTSCFQQLFFLYTRRSEFNDKTHLEEFISAKASDQIPEQVPLSKGPQRGDLQRLRSEYPMSVVHHQLTKMDVWQCYLTTPFYLELELAANVRKCHDFPAIQKSYPIVCLSS